MEYSEKEQRAKQLREQLRRVASLLTSDSENGELIGDKLDKIIKSRDESKLDKYIDSAEEQIDNMKEALGI